MNALLWTLAAVGAINTIMVLLNPGGAEMTFARKVDALYTAAIGVWAFYLLMRG